MLEPVLNSAYSCRVGLPEIVQTVCRLVQEFSSNPPPVDTSQTAPSDAPDVHIDNPLHEGDLLWILHVKGQSLEAGFDSICQQANCPAWILSVVLGQIPDFKRLTETGERIGTEAPSGLELEAHRENAERQLKVKGRFGLQGNSSGAGLEGCHAGIVLAESFREYGGDATLSEQGFITVQSRQIAVHRPVLILSPDQRNRSKGRQNGAQGAREQGVFGSQMNRSWQQAHQDGGVEERIGVVRHQQNRPLSGNEFHSLDLDGTVVDPKRNPQKPLYENPQPVSRSRHDCSLHGFRIGGKTAFFLEKCSQRRMA